MLDDLISRGLVYQTTLSNELLATWLSEPRTLYCGFDPTADSLHIGSLVALLMLRRFQFAGHKVIVLLGDTTAMIGDPSGKSQERNLLDREKIQDNCAHIRRQVQGILGDVKIVNNTTWLQHLTAVELLRGIGQHFTIHNMMARDCVKSRLGNLSYTEFSYMLLQAYDFAWLNRTQRVQMQIGGSDQWGNMMSGLDLCRIWNHSNVQCLTFPLLTRSDGAKMGKTESGTIWLSGARTSPYHFYQYWLNLPDDDVGKCLMMLTFDSLESIRYLLSSNPSQRLPQKRLANLLTRLVHGPEGVQMAQAATRIFFGEEFSDLDDGMLRLIFKDVPHSEAPREVLAGDGYSLANALVDAHLVRTRGEARRAIEQGGAYVNNKRVQKIDRRLTFADLVSQSAIILRKGKKEFGVLWFQ